MFLDNGFRDPQLIDTVANSLDCLTDGAVLQFRQRLRLHRQGPGVLCSGRQLVLGQAVAHDRAQISAGFRRHTFDNDLVRIIYRVRLADLRVIDLAGAQVRLQSFDRVVRLHIHRIVHLHLKDQVGPAFEVQAQVNSFLQRSQQPLARKFFRDAEYPYQKHD